MRTILYRFRAFFKKINLLYTTEAFLSLPRLDSVPITKKTFCMAFCDLYVVKFNRHFFLTLAIVNIINNFLIFKTLFLCFFVNYPLLAIVLPLWQSPVWSYLLCITVKYVGLPQDFILYLPFFFFFFLQTFPLVSLIQFSHSSITFTGDLEINTSCSKPYLWTPDMCIITY